MQILEQGIVYSGAENPELTSCSFPSICCLHNGTILASFKGAARKFPDNKSDHAMYCMSFDGGKTWTAPKEVFAPPVVDGKKTTLRTVYFVEAAPGNVVAVANAVDATLEDLPYYNEDTEGLKDTFIMVAHSADNGETWSEPTRVQVQTFYDLPIPLTGAPFLTKEGRIGIQFEVNKPYYEESYWVHHSAVVYSADGGYTWGDEVVITDNPTVYYWDQRLSCLDNGRVMDIFWTFDRTKGDYINIHLTSSSDGGRSFPLPRDIGLVGQPGNVINGKNGELLTIYINRDAAPVIRLAKSTDGGETWSDALTVFDYGANTKGKQNAGMNDVWSEMFAFAIGHPFLAKLDADTVLAYFYSGPSTHRTDFCYVKIAL